MLFSKKGWAYIGAITLVALVIFGFVKKDAIKSKFDFATKQVGKVQDLEESSHETDEILNAEVRTTVDYELPEHALPSDKKATKKSKLITGEGIMWNGSASLCGANGGKETKKGSYIDELGDFNLKLKRQDEYSIQQDDLVLFGSEYLKSGGKTTTKGVAFVWYMGDNSEVYQSVTNAKLQKIDPSLKTIGFAIAGYSDGEDKFMGLQEWKDDPEKARGAVVACYPQDGDQNLVIKWAADNNIPINPDPATYCPDAINFQFVNSFMEAAEAWGTKTGKRLIVDITEDGGTIKTGETSEPIEIWGTATWTPGDEKAFNKARQRGVDLVSIYSTKDNAHQMPCLLVTINKFAEENPKIIDALIEAMTKFGDQMKVHDKAFQYAMEAMRDVYEYESAQYWAQYYNGVAKKTVNDYEVILGGTRVCNMADNLDAFGLGDDARGTFKSSYELFGGYMHTLYPEVLPERLPYYEAIDPSYVERVASKMKAENTLTKVEKTEFKTGTIKEDEKVAERSYKIEFEIGKATLTVSGKVAVEKMYNDLNTHDLRIRIIGHTDNTGTDATNEALSIARAETVKKRLQELNSASFPGQRFEEVSGKGSREPIADNTSASGKARNRRVEITVGY